MDLQRLIHLYLRFWSRLAILRHRPFIVGVTGSAGKSTTTAMIASVLEHEEAHPILGDVAHTVKNMNDDKGLPLTVLRYANWPTGNFLQRLTLYLMLPFRAIKLASLGSYPKILVLEYGAGWGGSPDWLVKIAPPDMAVVTTIGPAHLERMRTMESIVRAKGALVEATPPSGLVILGQDHDYVHELEARARARVIKLPGRGLPLSREIAKTVARHLNVPGSVVEAGLEAFRPLSGRLNRLQLDHLIVLDDSYNANPLSVDLGLQSLREAAGAGSRRVAVLGEMTELGDEAPRFHRQTGILARGYVDLLIGVGNLAKYYDPDVWYPSSHACAEEIAQILRPEDCVLVKGSRAVHMRRIVECLKKDWAFFGQDENEPESA